MTEGGEAVFLLVYRLIDYLRNWQSMRSVTNFNYSNEQRGDLLSGACPAFLDRIAFTGANALQQKAA